MSSANAVAPVPIRADAEVVSNTDDGGGNRRLVLRVAGWPGSGPGQFVMLSPGARSAVLRTDPLLPRPMAVYRTRPGKGSADLEVLYKITGRGTALLAEAGRGASIGLVGPLGIGFPAPAAGERALLVGGGTGIASLFELAAHAAASGRDVTVLLGGRRAIDLMGRADFESLSSELQVATEDGSAGHRGYVTEILDALLSDGLPSTVYACGPTPMMQRCAEIASQRGAGCRVSLENGMACGFGVCLGCAVPRSDEGYALVCRDGPVFDANAIALDRLP